MTKRNTNEASRLGEAAAGSFEHRREAIRRELSRMFGGDGPWPVVVALFQDPDQVMAEARDGKLTRHDYALGRDGTAALSNPVLVEETFRVAEMTAAESAADPGRLIEAGSRPGRWAVRVIRAGLSGNGNYYPPRVLREAAPLFSGARVLARSDEDHLAGRDKSVSALIGRIADPAWLDENGGELRATMELIEADGALAGKLKAAHERGMTDLMGLSIVAAGRHRIGSVSGRPVRMVEAITRVESVNLVVEPGAGGAILDFIEAARGAGGTQGDDAMRERVKKFIEAKLGKAKLDAIDATDDDAVEALYREAGASEAAGNTGNGAGGGNDTGTPAVTPEDVDSRIAEAVRLTEARADARAEIAASALPDAAKARLEARFAEAASIGADDARNAIEAERKYLAGIAGGGHVAGLGTARAELTEGLGEKTAKMLDALLDPKDSSMTSLKEAYVQVTGDRRVTGMVQACDRALMREALQSTSLAEILGDSITRRMIADYRETGIHDGWARLVTVVPVSDFRTQRRIRWGGYGNLPEVGEGVPYTALTSPGEEEETYAPSKRGGTESVTLEAIKNDDLGQIMRIPARLSRAAKRTVSKFVFDFYTANGNLADGVALFHATHKNLGTAALAKASLAAGRLAMVEQKEKDSNETLGIGPRYLLVPFQLEETAADLFRRNTENDRTFVQSLSLAIVAVPHFTDANDWYLSADPNDIPTIEVGFLDGRQEPELFVQDTPSQGSLFSHDQITYKIRHIYGGTVLDHRGLYKAAVA